jgi:hypothetical protein
VHLIILQFKNWSRDCRLRIFQWNETIRTGILQYFHWFYSIGMIYSFNSQNSSWVFSEPKKEVCRFAMASQSKSSNFLHVVEEEQCGEMDIWCTSGLRSVRRHRSITRGDLDADQWCVRLSMSRRLKTEKNCVDDYIRWNFVNFTLWI